MRTTVAYRTLLLVLATAGLTTPSPGQFGTPTNSLASGLVDTHPSLPTANTLLERPALLDLEGTPIPEALRRLNEASGVVIAFSPSETVAIRRTVTCDCFHRTVRETLDEIVRDHLNSELLKLWAATKKTIAFVTHSIPEAVYLSTKIVVMSPRPGRVTDVIESTLPAERPLEIRETPEFLAIAHRVRAGLRAGQSYGE